MRTFGAITMILALTAGAVHGETVRLKATADIWLSDANAEERDSSCGTGDQFKIKTIQEMAAIRFDASPAAGKVVLKAKLFMRRADADKLRYIRVSTVNGDWVEGKGSDNYGPGNGATYNHADHASKRPWAWKGSQFCDVIMGSGNTLDCWGESVKTPDGWLSVPITPAMIYAMLAGDTDGLAVMDGGNIAFTNNFVYSVQSGKNAPYIEVELGKGLTAAPGKPKVTLRPAPKGAHLGTGAIGVSIAPAKGAVCWRVKVDGKPVESARAGSQVAVLVNQTPFYGESGGQVGDRRRQVRQLRYLRKSRHWLRLLAPLPPRALLQPWSRRRAPLRRCLPQAGRVALRLRTPRPAALRVVPQPAPAGRQSARRPGPGPRSRPR
ncbi:hypothetical protein LCGC14_1795030, partial [marine sediment metagenome]